MRIKDKFRCSESHDNKCRHRFHLHALTSVLITLFIASSLWVVSASSNDHHASPSSMMASNTFSGDISIESSRTHFKERQKEPLSSGNDVLVHSSTYPITRHALTTAAIFETIQEPNPTIQDMIDQVNQDTIYTYTGDLSGEWPVQIGHCLNN